MWGKNVSVLSVLSVNGFGVGFQDGKKTARTARRGEAFPSPEAAPRKEDGKNGKNGKKIPSCSATSDLTYTRKVKHEQKA